jgi:hypothetical protein
MQLLRTAAALIAVCLLASSAAADGSGKLAAVVGSAAVKGAHTLNTIPASVIAADRPDQTSPSTSTSADATTAGVGGELGSRGFGSSRPGQRQRLAVQLRSYLERVFRDRPDALSRIKEAWEKEQEQHQQELLQGGSGVSWYTL